MTKAREPVTFLGFNQDAQVVHEFTDTRMVYRYADGTLETNNLGRKPAFMCGGRVIAYNWQTMPCRASARLALAEIVKVGAWEVHPRTTINTAHPGDNHEEDNR